jgi:hypothetical protein
MRLHEIEIGVGSTEQSKKFYEMLGLKLNVDQSQLKVFNAATQKLISMFPITLRLALFVLVSSQTNYHQSFKH